LYFLIITHLYKIIWCYTQATRSTIYAVNYTTKAAMLGLITG
jgi:hypothetical protein